MIYLNFIAGWAGSWYFNFTEIYLRKTKITWYVLHNTCWVPHICTLCKEIFSTISPYQKHCCSTTLSKTSYISTNYSIINIHHYTKLSKRYQVDIWIHHICNNIYLCFFYFLIFLLAVHIYRGGDFLFKYILYTLKQEFQIIITMLKRIHTYVYAANIVLSSSLFFK